MKNTFLYPDSEFPLKTLLQEKSKTLIVSHQKTLYLTSQSKARVVQPVQLSQNNYRIFF